MLGCLGWEQSAASLRAQDAPTPACPQATAGTPPVQNSAPAPPRRQPESPGQIPPVQPKHLLPSGHIVSLQIFMWFPHYGSGMSPKCISWDVPSPKANASTTTLSSHLCPYPRATQG
ncbi:uncharacterized protein LOC143273016 isoform X5 [Peromyscus maniculatus bairdii]|uniref:uncharacterized protein LOC143273016 isoform X5 n=1 Tax=Peromyscus maniculatus bairdii TaxID=230844 RepID=UPI003FD2728B